MSSNLVKNLNPFLHCSSWHLETAKHALTLTWRNISLSLNICFNLDKRKGQRIVACKRRVQFPPLQTYLTTYIPFTIITRNNCDKEINLSNFRENKFLGKGQSRCKVRTSIQSLLVRLSSNILSPFYLTFPFLVFTLKV